MSPNPFMPPEADPFAPHGPEPYTPMPPGGGLVPSVVEYFKNKIRTLFGTAVFTVNNTAPVGGNVNVSVADARDINAVHYTVDNKTDAEKAIARANIGVPTKTSELTNDGDGTKQFLTEHQSLAGYAKTTELPTKTSDLVNDSGFIESTIYDGGKLTITTGSKGGLGIEATVTTIENDKITVGNRVGVLGAAGAPVIDSSGFQVASTKYGTTSVTRTATTGSGPVTYTLSLPDKSGTVAVTSDIPDISGKLDKTGGTISGDLTVDGAVGLTAKNYVSVGHALIVGTTGVTTGYASGGISVGSREMFFPQRTGDATFAMTDDLPYPINKTGTILDRHINVVTSGTITIPEGFTDLVIRYTGALQSFSFVEDDVTPYGDGFTSESANWLVTVTRTDSKEAFIKTLNMGEVIV